MKIIFIGDIFGKIGRRALAEIVPRWRKKYKPDVVIGNGENLAHGIGMTETTMRQALEAGLDCLTGGNHSFKAHGAQLLAREDLPLLRPANFPPGTVGRGEMVLNSPDGKSRLLVLNLIGRVFFQAQYDDPFRKLDEILKKYPEEVDGILVDFHCEATSEANALGNYADGRVSAVLGTHTSMGTTDTRILPKGTAYVTEVGGVQAVDSILGEEKQGIIRSFLLQQPFKHEPVETGLCQVSAVLVDINEKTKLSRSIKRIDEQIIIE